MPLRFLVVLIVFALCSPADAQRPKKVPRIGFLSTTSFPLVRVEAFQQGLRELGWVEGRNITVEHRHPERNFDQAAADLVRLSADIIVTGRPDSNPFSQECNCHDSHRLYWSWRSCWKRVCRQPRAPWR